MIVPVKPTSAVRLIMGNNMPLEAALIGGADALLFVDGWNARLPPIPHNLNEFRARKMD